MIALGILHLLFEVVERVDSVVDVKLVLVVKLVACVELDLDVIVFVKVVIVDVTLCVPKV